jgi:hypothetical protein
MPLAGIAVDAMTGCDRGQDSNMPRDLVHCFRTRQASWVVASNRRTGPQLLFWRVKK